MRADSAVEPTKSENITVTWRRSAVSCNLTGTADAVAAAAISGALLSVASRLRIARSILRRSPRTMPSFSKSWSVRSGRTEKSMRFSAKRCAYSDMPSFSSQSAICCIAARSHLGNNGRPYHH